MKMHGSFQQMFHQMSNQNIRWDTALGELIDNSFDAGSTRVEIEIANKLLTVRDDGRGCQDITKMMPLASHFDQGAVEQPVGMYGIGLKDAWAFCGDRISIDTVHRGQRGYLELRVDQVDANWDAPDPKYGPAPESPSGTQITLCLKQSRKQPDKSTLEKLAWLFTPALESGRQVAIKKGSGKKIVLSATQMPPFQESIQDEFEVSGKHVKLNVGIVKDGYRMERGPFWITYGHRIIKNSGIGAGEFSTQRMGGRIDLGAGWALTKNKDDLSDFASELAEAIYSRIQSLLAKHDSLVRDITTKALIGQIESILNGGLEDAKKEKRKPSEGSTPEAPVLPANSGRKRRRAAKVQDGKGSIEIAGRGRRHGFTIDFIDEDSISIGRFDSLANRVNLNVNHPFVAAGKKSDNAPALCCAAACLIGHTACTSVGSQKLITFDCTLFDTTVGYLLKSLQEHMEANNGKA